MTKKAKFVFNYDDLKTDLTLEEVIALISTGDRNSPEYGLTVMILKKLTTGSRSMTKKQMYDLYMRNRDQISKASFYRILTKLITRGMVLYDEEVEQYQPSVFFSNALQRLAISWERIVIKELIN